MVAKELLHLPTKFEADKVLLKLTSQPYTRAVAPLELLRDNAGAVAVLPDDPGRLLLR